MCEPTTIIALSSLAVGGIAANEQSIGQQKALNRSAAAQAEQQGARLQQQVGERVAQARRERSRLLVAAGEAGLSGRSQSFAAQIQANFARQNRDIGTARQNAGYITDGIRTRAEGQASQIQSGLQILGGVAAGAGQVFANRPTNPSDYGSTPNSGLQIPLGAPLPTAGARYG